MAALVVVALFWGNCFSCPQTLLASASHQCCKPHKQTSSRCETQNLQQFVKADIGAPVPAMPVVAQAVMPAILFLSEPPSPAPGEYSPPGSPALHSILRV